MDPSEHSMIKEKMEKFLTELSHFECRLECLDKIWDLIVPIENKWSHIRVTNSYDYDTRHNLKEVTDPESGNTSYEYNLMNQLTHISLPNNTCKTIKYDGLGRLEEEIWGK